MTQQTRDDSGKDGGLWSRLRTAPALLAGVFFSIIISSIFDLAHWPWGEIAVFTPVSGQVVGGFSHLVRRYSVEHSYILGVQTALVVSVSLVEYYSDELSTRCSGWGRMIATAGVFLLLVVAYRAWFVWHASQLHPVGKYLPLVAVAGVTALGLLSVGLASERSPGMLLTGASALMAFGVGGASLAAGQYLLPEYAVDGQLTLYSTALLVFPFVMLPLQFLSRGVARWMIVVFALSLAAPTLWGFVVPLDENVRRMAARASLEKGEESQIADTLSAECEELVTSESGAEAAETFVRESNFPELSSEADVENYNFLFVMFEATRGDSTSLAAPTLQTTPNLRRLAERSWVFEDAYSPSSATFQALPSILAMVPPSYLHLAVGDRPFDTAYRGGPRQLHRVLRDEMGYFTFASTYSTYTDLWPSDFDHGMSRLEEVESGEFTDLADKRVNRKTFEILRQWKRRGEEEPFWGLVFYGGTHQPYAPDLDASQRERYHEAIRRVDRRLGQLLAGLDRLEIADETIVVVTADHGERLDFRGGAGHALTVYPAGVHVPLVVHVPETAGGSTSSVVDRPVSTAHVFPWLFLEFPDETPIRSLVQDRLRQFVAPILEVTGTPAISELIHDNFMRTGMYWSDRAAIYDSFVDRFEWYDRKLDPHLRSDLAPYNFERVRKDRERMNRYLGLRGCHRKFVVDAEVDLTE